MKVLLARRSAAKAGTRPSRTGIAALLVALLAALLAATAAEAQFGRGRSRFNARVATAEDHDGAFHFCRAWFRSGLNGDGGNWSVDYPRADLNLSIRLAELTSTPVSVDAGAEPNHLIVRLTDDALFQCPFVMMTEVGSAFFDEREAARLREYLLKGGFLWVDDFWGSYAWQAWEQEFRKVLQAAEYPNVDLPLSHPIFRALFEVKRVPQIPSINHWRGGARHRSARSRQRRAARA
jgi:hypothetical protein